MYIQFIYIIYIYTRTHSWQNSLGAPFFKDERQLQGYTVIIIICSPNYISSILKETLIWSLMFECHGLEANISYFKYLNSFKD